MTKDDGARGCALGLTDVQPAIEACQWPALVLAPHRSFLLLDADSCSLTDGMPQNVPGFRIAHPISRIVVDDACHV